MKKFSILFMIFSILFASCSQVNNNGRGYNLNISGRQILARVADDGSQTPYAIKVEVNAAGKIETLKESGTLAELKEKSFEFKEIPVGTTAVVYCEVIYAEGIPGGGVIYKGESQPITIDSEENYAFIKMEKQYEDKGEFGNTVLRNFCDTNDINCKTLTKFAIPYGYTVAGGDPGHAIFPSDTDRPCPNVETVIIPDTVTLIKNHAFHGTTITSINIPASVTSIGEHAFYQCESLTSIIIPASVTSVGANAFASCTKLESVIFENPIDWQFICIHKDGSESSTPERINNLNDPQTNEKFRNNGYSESHNSYLSHDDFEPLLIKN